VFYDAVGQSTFDYLPLTFHIKDGLTDSQFNRFVEAYTEPLKN